MRKEATQLHLCEDCCESNFLEQIFAMFFPFINADHWVFLMQICVALILGICPVKHILPFSPRGNSQQQFWIVFYFSKTNVETFVWFWETLRLTVWYLISQMQLEPMMRQINIYLMIKRGKIPYHSGASAFLAINNICVLIAPSWFHLVILLVLKYPKQVSWEH